MNIPLSVIFLHFVGDWFLQSDWMALNKSKRWDALLIHCLVANFVLSFYSNKLALWAFLFHFVIDAVTSRITTKLWFIEFAYNAGSEPWPFYARMRDTRHWFFVVIGLDQFLHYLSFAVILRFLL
jgi:hypothetical protein